MNVQVIGGLSYRVSTDFYDKVLAKVQHEFKNSWSYWKIELFGIRVIGIILQLDLTWHNFKVLLSCQITINIIRMLQHKWQSFYLFE